MTNWSPQLSTKSGPIYLAIVEQLARDLGAGALKAGDRLPTHRDLAWTLKVTVGTITRAYAEAERRGLVTGEVGRGTFVRDRNIDAPPAAAANEGFVDLARAFPVEGIPDPVVARTLADVARDPALSRLLGYATNLGLPDHRAAGATWIARTGLAATADDVAITNGAQHGMALAMAGVARAGETVLTEQLTYYGMKSLATTLSLKLHGVAIDAHGLVPEALDLACRQTGAKALYCIPTIQNPTTSVMPAARREEIASICRRHGVVVVEDDIYGFLATEAPPPIASFAPDHSIYITSLSKSVAPALRIGYIRASAALLERIAMGMRAMTWMASPILAETASRIIRSGDAAQLAEAQRTEAIARQAIAARCLAGYDMATHAASFHVWLTLPEPWRREEFTVEARRRGVGVAPAEAFAVGRGQVPHAVRVGLSAAPDRATLERALTTLADIPRAPPDRNIGLV